MELRSVASNIGTYQAAMGFPLAKRKSQVHTCYGYPRMWRTLPTYSMHHVVLLQGVAFGLNYNVSGELSLLQGVAFAFNDNVSRESISRRMKLA